MSLTVKASLYSSWSHSQPIETRRFTIDQEVAASFTYLIQKLAQVFSNLEADKIIVAYTDTDGDRVTISTDDELTEALSQFDGTIFRILIKKNDEELRDGAQSRPHHPPWFRHPGYWNRRGPPHFLQDLFNNLQQAAGQQQPPANAEEEKKEKETETEQQTTTPPNKKTPGPYHPGVICDGCSGSIYGKRYKCCECPDYDLCEGCEGKGVHTDHDMYTIDRPAFCGGGGGWRCGGRPGGFWGGHGQLGPFGFNLWSHPGRCGGQGWGGNYCPANGGANGCCPANGGGNECCPSKETSEEQKPTAEDMETTTAEAQPDQDEVEKKPEEQ